MPIARGAANVKGQILDDALFMSEFTAIGASQMARKHSLNEKGIYDRRRRIEQREGIALTPPTRGGHVQQLDQHPAAINLGIQDGEILVGSDAHFWPGIVTTAYRAFLAFAKERKPKVIVLNGDVTDFPSISRHAPIAWETRPSVAAEIENTKAMLSELEKVSPHSRRIWGLGNHDSRFETRLATVAPEYAKVHGVHLKDAFPRWEPCWAAFVNKDVVIKHRMKGGIHATRNNTLNAGRSMVTGHLHQLKVTPLSDYNGVRYGVDCGTLAEPYGPQFYNYCELGPMDWRSGVRLAHVQQR